jgi:uncharacterized membrane protein HdeD (DUF308 family)
MASSYLFSMSGKALPFLVYILRRLSLSLLVYKLVYTGCRLAETTGSDDKEVHMRAPMGMPMGKLSTQTRWWLALRGIIAILFGFVIWIWPSITFRILLAAFAVFVIVAGIFAIVAGIKATNTRRRWFLLFEGVVGVLAGAVTLGWPAITARALLFIIAAWAALTGITEIVGAFQKGQGTTQDWLLVVSGVISLVFAGLLLALPAAGVVALVWLIGAYVVIYGIILLALAITGGFARGEAPRTGAAT